MVDIYGVYTGVFYEYNIIIHYNSVKKYMVRFFKNIGIGDLLMFQLAPMLPMCTSAEL